MTIGYIKKLGKGTVLHLGVEQNKELIFAILRYFCIPLYAYTTTKDVKTALYKKGQKYYLIAVNNGMEDKSAAVLFPDMRFQGGRFKVREIVSRKGQQFLSAKIPTLSIELPRKDGKVFEISRL